MIDILGIIPVKEHSIRFPDKNFKKILARSLIEIAAEKLLDICDEVVISTDVPDRVTVEIASLLDTHKDYLSIQKRPSRLCENEVQGSAVACYVLEQVDCKPYHVIYSQVTTPLWSVSQLRHALRHFRTRSLKSLVSVNPSFQPNGAFYICDVETLLQEKELTNIWTHLYVMDYATSVDIDYPHQLHIAAAVEGGDFIWGFGPGHS